MNQHLEQHGFAIVPNVLSADEQQSLIEALGPVDGAGRRGLLLVIVTVVLLLRR